MSDVDELSNVTGMNSDFSDSENEGDTKITDSINKYLEGGELNSSARDAWSGNQVTALSDKRQQPEKETDNVECADDGREEVTSEDSTDLFSRDAWSGNQVTVLSDKRQQPEKETDSVECADGSREEVTSEDSIDPFSRDALSGNQVTALSDKRQQPEKETDSVECADDGREEVTSEDSIDVSSSIAANRLEFLRDTNRDVDLDSTCSERTSLYSQESSLLKINPVVHQKVSSDSKANHDSDDECSILSYQDEKSCDRQEKPFHDERSQDTSCRSHQITTSCYNSEISRHGEKSCESDNKSKHGEMLYHSIANSRSSDKVHDSSDKAHGSSDKAHGSSDKAHDSVKKKSHSSSNKSHDSRKSNDKRHPSHSDRKSSDKQHSSHHHRKSGDKTARSQNAEKSCDRQNKSHDRDRSSESGRSGKPSVHTYKSVVCDKLSNPDKKFKNCDNKEMKKKPVCNDDFRKSDFMPPVREKLFSKENFEQKLHHSKSAKCLSFFGNSANDSSIPPSDLGRISKTSEKFHSCPELIKMKVNGIKFCVAVQLKNDRKLWQKSFVDVADCIHKMGDRSSVACTKFASYSNFEDVTAHKKSKPPKNMASRKLKNEFGKHYDGGAHKKSHDSDYRLNVDGRGSSMNRNEKGDAKIRLKSHGDSSTSGTMRESKKDSRDRRTDKSNHESRLSRENSVSGMGPDEKLRPESTSKHKSHREENGSLDKGKSSRKSISVKDGKIQEYKSHRESTTHDSKSQKHSHSLDLKSHKENKVKNSESNKTVGVQKYQDSKLHKHSKIQKSDSHKRNDIQNSKPQKEGQVHDIKFKNVGPCGEKIYEDSPSEKSNHSAQENATMLSKTMDDSSECAGNFFGVVQSNSTGESKLQISEIGDSEESVDKIDGSEVVEPELKEYREIGDIEKTEMLENTEHFAILDSENCLIAKDQNYAEDLEDDRLLEHDKATDSSQEFEEKSPTVMNVESGTTDLGVCGGAVAVESSSNNAGDVSEEASSEMKEKSFICDIVSDVVPDQWRKDLDSKSDNHSYDVSQIKNVGSVHSSEEEELSRDVALDVPTEGKSGTSAADESDAALSSEEGRLNFISPSAPQLATTLPTHDTIVKSPPPLLFFNLEKAKKDSRLQPSVKLKTLPDALLKTLLADWKQSSRGRITSDTCRSVPLLKNSTTDLPEIKGRTSEKTLTDTAVKELSEKEKRKRHIIDVSASEPPAQRPKYDDKKSKPESASASKEESRKKEGNSSLPDSITRTLMKVKSEFKKSQSSDAAPAMKKFKKDEVREKTYEEAGNKKTKDLSFIIPKVKPGQQKMKKKKEKVVVPVSLPIPVQKPPRTPIPKKTLTEEDKGRSVLAKLEEVIGERGNLQWQTAGDVWRGKPTNRPSDYRGPGAATVSRTEDQWKKPDSRYLNWNSPKNGSSAKTFQSQDPPLRARPTEFNQDFSPGNLCNNASMNTRQPNLQDRRPVPGGYVSKTGRDSGGWVGYRRDPLRLQDPAADDTRMDFSPAAGANDDDDDDDGYNKHGSGNGIIADTEYADSLRVLSEAIQEFLLQGEISSEKREKLVAIYARLQKGFGANNCSFPEEASIMNVFCNSATGSMMPVSVFKDILKEQSVSSELNRISNPFPGDWRSEGNHRLRITKDVDMRNKNAGYSDIEKRTVSVDLQNPTRHDNMNRGQTDSLHNFGNKIDQSFQRRLPSRSPEPGPWFSASRFSASRDNTVENWTDRASDESGACNSRVLPLSSGIKPLLDCSPGISEPNVFHMDVDERQRDFPRDIYQNFSSMKESQAKREDETQRADDSPYLMKYHGSVATEPRDFGKGFQRTVLNHEKAALGNTNETSVSSDFVIQNAKTVEINERKFGQNEEILKSADTLNDRIAWQESIVSRIDDEMQMLEVLVSIQSELSGITSVNTSTIEDGSGDGPVAMLEEAPPVSAAVTSVSNTTSSSTPCQAGTSLAVDGKSQESVSQSSNKDNENETTEKKNRNDPEAVKEMAVKVARNTLKPYYHDGRITSSEFKVIMKKTIAKVSSNQDVEFDERKIMRYVRDYVTRVIKERKTVKM